MILPISQFSLLCGHYDLDVRLVELCFYYVNVSIDILFYTNWCWIIGNLSMMIKSWIIGKVALFPLRYIKLVVELSLNVVVLYDPFMVAVFTFLSLSIFYDHVLEVNMCKMIQCEYYHECEVLCLVSNTNIIFYVYWWFFLHGHEDVRDRLSIRLTLMKLCWWMTPYLCTPTWTCCLNHD